MKILITGAMGAAAYQLKSKLIGNDVLLGDYGEIPSTMLTNGSMIKLPSPTDPAYMHLMLALCLDANIGTIYALHQTEFAALNNAHVLFEEYGIEIKSVTNEI